MGLMLIHTANSTIRISTKLVIFYSLSWTIRILIWICILLISPSIIRLIERVTLITWSFILVIHLTLPLIIVCNCSNL
jgi:hypothetical protein